MPESKESRRGGRQCRALLLASSFLTLAPLWTSTGPAQAQDATWLANPGSADFNTGSNWDTGNVPTGTAYFGATSTSGLTVLSNTSIGGWTFNAGASGYGITNNFTLAFTGAGIAVNGGSLTINNNSDLSFSNGSTAGSATIDNRWNLNFYDSSSAGSATIINSNSLFSTLTFNNTSTAGNASITNLYELTFYGNTTAGSATITNYGTVLFDGNSTAGSAQLINSGSSAVVNFWTPGPASDGRITAGSLAGSGRFDLNSIELTVGSNNLSTEVTGVLTGDGLVTGTSLIKTGTGTLTLSGTNTYTGATIINDGALIVNGSIAASSSLTMNSGTTLGGTGTVGATTIASGATLAPGNSIGTLSVSGNLTLRPTASKSRRRRPTAPMSAARRL